LSLALRFWTQFRSFLVQGLLFLLPDFFCSFLMLQLPVLGTGVALLADTRVDTRMDIVMVLAGKRGADNGADIALGTTTNLGQSLGRVLCAILSQIQMLDS
jgi:hypothetical protein